MTVSEEKDICRQFKEAKDKSGMVLILSQLNDCSREDIVAILKKHGFEDPRKTDKRKTKSTMPDSARNALVERMETIDCMIKELEKEYKEIAAYIGG